MKFISLRKQLLSMAIWSLPLLFAINALAAYEQCGKTEVVILGAGVAGIIAAQTLHNNSINNFIIVEYNPEIGGRMRNAQFGDKNYPVEFGANWVEGLGTQNGPQNPIWQMVQKYKMDYTYSNFSSLTTYDENGTRDYTSLIADYKIDYKTFEQDAGTMLTENLEDRSARAGLSLSGWKPGQNKTMQAVEWWQWDWESAYEPEYSSQIFGVAGANATFNQFSGDSVLVHDSRGYSFWLKEEAKPLNLTDSNLWLSTVVTNVTYTDQQVTITTKDGRCIEADFAICTFSLGVLQNDAVAFEPPLPQWKREGIETFAMGTYTKIFLQFRQEDIFWDRNDASQFLLYADPHQRGYYPAWEPLDIPGFLPGSGIIFGTVTHEEAYRIESQGYEKTKKEVLEVLGMMFQRNIPEPIAFAYPNWTHEPWAYGSYSNWPQGVSLKMHQNLRANVDRLWFAGEATSSQNFGFLHGAYFEGQLAGTEVASCIHGNCTGRTHYEKLPGTVEFFEYSLQNGWRSSTFENHND